MTERPIVLSPETPSEHAVLNNLSEHVRDCLQHAEDCAQRAAVQTDPTLKADFLDLEWRWLALARSYDFTERLDDFCSESKRQGGGDPPKQSRKK